MLHVIYRDWTEWVEAFSTLAEAQTRFDALKAECPDWNLQILEVADRQTHITMMPTEASVPPTVEAMTRDH